MPNAILVFKVRVTKLDLVTCYWRLINYVLGGLEPTFRLSMMDSHFGHLLNSTSAGCKGVAALPSVPESCIALLTIMDVLTGVISV